MRGIQYISKLRNLEVEVRTAIIDTVNVLFLNHTDIAKEINFTDVGKCSRPVFDEPNDDCEFSTFIDEIRVENNTLYFTQSSQVTDAEELSFNSLTLDHLITILIEIESLTEKDLGL